MSNKCALVQTIRSMAGSLTALLGKEFCEISKNEDTTIYFYNDDNVSISSQDYLKLSLVCKHCTTGKIFYKTGDYTYNPSSNLRYTSVTAELPDDINLIAELTKIANQKRKIRWLYHLRKNYEGMDRKKHYEKVFDEIKKLRLLLS